MSLGISQSFAESQEFSVQGIKWLNEGNAIHFDGQPGKNITGKLYPKTDESNVPGKGSLFILFYKDKTEKGKPVFKCQKMFYENPDKKPFFEYNFPLNELPEGDYFVKVVASHSVLGWLNY
jgi:hypothetical protein